MKTGRWRAALWQVLVLVALSFGAAVGTHFWHPQAPSWYLQNSPEAEDEVTMERVRAEWSGEVLWLDARPTEQYAKAHLSGALPLNEQGFDDQLFVLLEVLQDNQKPVVVYCGGERCEASRKIKQRLVESLPLENVWILKGGWRPD